MFVFPPSALQLYCSHRVNRETTARQKVPQAPEATECVTFVVPISPRCLLAVNVVI